ncbi:MAG: Ig-like domain-containing protein [Lachnospiraceae bacterium]|nr:Ig-like domain-containing protein [Lachnospiraceae bacterium]
MNNLSKKILTFCVAFLFCFSFIAVVHPSTASAASVKLSSKSVTLIKGQKKTLKVKGTKKKVTWSSNKKSVATVSSKGKITAKQKGTATITAKVAGKKLKCKVRVEKPHLKDTYVAMTTGSTKQLTLKGTSQKVKWSTKKSSIATVSSKGVVKGVKRGHTTITATVLGKKYNCTVKVISLKENYDKLKNLILTKGKTDENGDFYVQYRNLQEDIDASSTAICRITYVSASDQYKFEYSIEAKEDEDEMNLCCVMYVNVLNSNTASVEVKCYDSTDGEIIGKAKFNATKLDVYDELGDKFTVTSTNPKDKEKDIQEECDAYFSLGCMLWDSYLYDKLGLGLEDFGFLQYEME